MDWTSVFSTEGPAARLTVTLDKRAYSAGELVRGRVTLTVFRELTGDGTRRTLLWAHICN